MASAPFSSPALRLDRAVAADAAAVCEVVVALESSLYGHSAFSQADLEDQWADLDFERDAHVVRDGDRVVGYAEVRELDELARATAYVHPDAHGRGIGRLIATALEKDAAGRGARRIQNGVLEADAAARGLLESLGYRAVRVFREMRVELQAPPPPTQWPDGLRVLAFDAERDAREFHAAHQEAFADHWDHTPAPPPRRHLDLGQRHTPDTDRAQLRGDRRHHHRPLHPHRPAGRQGAPLPRQRLAQDPRPTPAHPRNGTLVDAQAIAFRA